MVITFENITKLKNVEKKLHDDQFRALTENLPNIIFTIDQEGTILYMNHAPSGLELSEIIGASMYAFMLPQYHEIVKAHVLSVFEKGERSHYDARGVGLNGTESHYTSDIGPMCGADGRVISAIISTQDITEYEKKEQAPS